MTTSTFFPTSVASVRLSKRVRKLQVWFVFCLLPLSFSFLPVSLAQQRTAPAIEVSFPNYSYPDPVTSLRQLDSKNAEAIFFGEKGMPDFHARLRRGSFEQLHKIGGDSVSFARMKYLGDAPEEPEYALRYHIWSMCAGSPSGLGVVQLLPVENGHLKVVQQILFNPRGSEKRAPLLRLNQTP
jgi:hypothetical protein